MNPWHLFATALAAQLRLDVPACSAALPDNDRVEIAVWRMDDLYSVADALTAKASGLCVIIAGTGGKNPDPSAKKLLMGGNFSLSVWAAPEAANDLKADDLCWQIAEAAHGFVSASGPNDMTRRLEILDVGILPSKKNFLVWEAIGSVKRLAAPPSL